jgi:hypothetical protein
VERVRERHQFCTAKGHHPGGIVIFIQFHILGSVITKNRMRYTKISELEKERHHSICSK